MGVWGHGVLEEVDLVKILVFCFCATLYWIWKRGESVWFLFSVETALLFGRLIIYNVIQGCS